MIIEIYADYICPWCYIGRHRLRRALEMRPNARFDLRWRAFQLNPDMPPAGIDRASYMASKFGSLDRALQMYSAVADAAAHDKLPLALDRITRTPNTMAAHRLVQFAASLNRPDVAVDRLVDLLFEAYFVHGEDIGDPTVLIDRARMVGLDPVEVGAFLVTEDGVAAVRTSDVVARQVGIQAVPFFVLNRRYGVAGAQEPDAILPLLDVAAAEAA